MASDNTNVGDLNASTSSKQAILPEKMPSTKRARSSNFEKALAQRALFGSRIKIKNNGARLLSSRLSKVCLADYSSDIGISVYVLHCLECKIV